MQVVTRQQLYNTQSKENTPSITVKSGEIFLVETELNGGPWLQSLEDRWEPSKSQGPNLCGCVAVEGAEPGQLLAVELLAVETGSLGYTGFAGWRNQLSQEIWPNQWDVVTKTVAIADGFVQWSDSLRLPVQPMVGTLGTAPAGEGISCALADRHGGNMDLQEVRAGTTVYLPVNVAGALLHVGDVHAIMGDGEINRGGGIECRGRVTLRTRLLPRPQGYDWIHLDDKDSIMTAACLGDPKSSFCAAANQLIGRMCREFGFSQQEAYLLLGQVLESRCTVYVSPMYTVVCKIARQFLGPRI